MNEKNIAARPVAQGGWQADCSELAERAYQARKAQDNKPQPPPAESDSVKGGA